MLQFVEGLKLGVKA